MLGVLKSPLVAITSLVFIGSVGAILFVKAMMELMEPLHPVTILGIALLILSLVPIIGYFSNKYKIQSPAVGVVFILAIILIVAGIYLGTIGG